MDRFVIITREGAPLANADGKTLLFASLQQAKRWAMAGERVEAASADQAGETVLEFAASNRTEEAGTGEQ